jgi:ABC-type multidrug transport system fused ATPase/permease subunit
MTARRRLILQADRIVVIEDGRIVESGTHEQLLARNGVFRRFNHMQFADGSLAYGEQRA